MSSDTTTIHWMGSRDSNRKSGTERERERERAMISEFFAEFYSKVFFVVGHVFPFFSMNQMNVIL